MITLNQNVMNFFTLSLLTRANVGQFYMVEFESLVTKQRFRCYPVVSAVNPRYVQFGVELIPTSGTVAPLDGIIRLSPSGSWTYKVYITNTKTLTPTTFTLSESGLMKLNPSCEETPDYFYVSPNEDASATVFMAKDCTDVCISWSGYGSSTYWQLAEQNWDCVEDCSTFGNDEDIFGQDTQYFVECTT